MVVTDGSARYWLRIMLPDEVTKNVFREINGLLVSMNVLSPKQDHHLTTTPRMTMVAMNTTPLVFVVSAEATMDHPENSDFFKVPNLNVPHATDSLHNALHTERPRLRVLQNRTPGPGLGSTNGR